MASRSKISRRRWSEAFKKRVVKEASQPGTTLADVAHRYDLDPRRISTWKAKFDTGCPVIAIGARGRKGPVARDQLDAYWIRKGGGDLFDYLSRYPGRFPTVHLKDIDAEGDFADVGHGLIDFPRFIAAAQAAGTRHCFVERDNPPDPAGSIRRSFAYLNQLTA